jgi:hypothetical protein
MQKIENYLRAVVRLDFGAFLRFLDELNANPYP